MHLPPGLILGFSPLGYEPQVWPEAGVVLGGAGGEGWDMAFCRALGAAVRKPGGH